MIFGADLGLSSSHSDNRSRSGIYFLWLENNIVYVGQALCLLSRAADHCADKCFDRSSFLLFEPCDLDFVESYFIWFLRPHLNKQVPLLGRVSSYLGRRVSAKAKSKVIEVLLTLPPDYVTSRFDEARRRDDNQQRTNYASRRKRLRLNEEMLCRFSQHFSTKTEAS